jgi:hypothetical protein
LLTVDSDCLFKGVRFDGFAFWIALFAEKQEEEVASLRFSKTIGEFRLTRFFLSADSLDGAVRVGLRQQADA